MDILTAENIYGLLESGSIPYRISVYDILTSTSTFAREAAEKGAPEGTVIIARSQTEGRGRKVGRRFHSPSDTGLYMSVVLRPNGGYESFLRITTAAAVAVCRAIKKETGRSPRIKWVNDILLEGKKVCGILTEGAFRSDGSGLSYAVLGVGVNVYPPKDGFPSELEDIAGSVSESVDPTLISRLAATFLNEFSLLYRKGGYMEEYRSLSSVVGNNVRIYRQPPAEGITEATPCEDAFAYGIDDDCRLLVRFPDGREEALFSGEISVR